MVPRKNTLIIINKVDGTLARTFKNEQNFRQNFDVEISSSKKRLHFKIFFLYHKVEKYDTNGILPPCWSHSYVDFDVVFGHKNFITLDTETKNAEK